MEPLLSIPATAVALGISIRGVHRGPQLDPSFPRKIKIGGRTLFDPAEVERYRRKKQGLE